MKSRIELNWKKKRRKEIGKKNEQARSSLMWLHVYVDIKLRRVVVLYITVKYMRCVNRFYVTVNNHE